MNGMGCAGPEFSRRCIKFDGLNADTVVLHGESFAVFNEFERQHASPSKTRGMGFDIWFNTVHGRHDSDEGFGRFNGSRILPQ